MPVVKREQKAWRKMIRRPGWVFRGISLLESMSGTPLVMAGAGDSVPVIFHWVVAGWACHCHVGVLLAKLGSNWQEVVDQIGDEAVSWDADTAHRGVGSVLVNGVEDCIVPLISVSEVFPYEGLASSIAKDFA